jgi:preprotein translocase subunit SecY
MTSELGRRVAFTLGALLVFRIGTYIPLPGIDLDVWTQIFRSQGWGVLGAFDMSSGGAVGRLAVFALGITPYVSAAVILQLAGFFVGRLRALRDAGEAGRRKIDRYTLVLTLLLAAFQSYGIAEALERISNLVANPGWVFRLSIIVTLTGGTMVLVWLADQITTRGFGNGIALILCAGIVTQLPQTIFGALDLGRQGVLSGNALAVLAVLLVALTGLVAFMEKARRYEPVAYSLREDSPHTSLLSFKLNGAGVVPSLVASWILGLVLAIAAYVSPPDPFTGRGTPHWLDPGQPLFLLGYAILIFLLVYLYTALVLDPSDTAERLKRYGGVIPQVGPGEPTAEHIDNVISRITLIGAIYFVVICLTPELLLSQFNVPLYLGGTSLLVLVCTVLDIERQARAYQAHQAGGLRQ